MNNNEMIDTDKNNLLETLNPEQKQAVLYLDSPLLIIAGAGSGKTKVITQKIAYLIREKEYSPYNILGVTFTNKAASEMKSRIESITGIDARFFNISTFHSLGLRILRESGSAVGFDRDWQVIDDADQKKILDKLIKENLSYFTNDMRDDLKRKINFAKMELIYPNNRDFLFQKGFTEDEVRIFTLYFKFQKENKVWDYEDLVSLPVKLFQTHEETRLKYAEKFRYVVVDEFQDTNPNQYELLRAIAGDHKNITIVGDDDQAIYSWRGASIRFLFNFED
ncbi:MAG TPA: UvrD-helicase domain-containing protein, partial [Candidatus Kapabacteria bacterium]|nr:UvrD-helicase domain-containing protein [Candidatus Kapabacteria bacterium]